jgi:hypothetical protein
MEDTCNNGTCCGLARTITVLIYDFILVLFICIIEFFYNNIKVIFLNNNVIKIIFAATGILSLILYLFYTTTESINIIKGCGSWAALVALIIIVIFIIISIYWKIKRSVENLDHKQGD